MVEPVPGVGGLEPFLVSDGRVASWADARIGHSLRDGDLPMPASHWRVGDLGLDIAAFGDGNADRARAVARYTVRNHGKQPRTVALALAWRPFQANPPTQFLAHRGGASPIETLKWEGGALWVNGALRLKPMQPPSSVRLEPAAAGPVGDWLAEAPPAGRPLAIGDADGFASAVLRYDMSLGPGEQRDHRRRPAASRRRACPRGSTSTATRPASRRAGGRARPGAHRRPGRGGRHRPDAAHRRSATCSSTAAGRPCSPAREPMRDRGSGTGR